jgi:hypothetical protein
MTEMYVCSKETVGEREDFFLMRKEFLLMMAANIMIFRPKFGLKFYFFGAILFFSVGGNNDNIRAAQQNEVGCILAQNTICKIT